VRELENVLERAMVLGSGPQLLLRHLAMEPGDRRHGDTGRPGSARCRPSVRAPARAGRAVARRLRQARSRAHPRDQPGLALSQAGRRSRALL